LHPAERAATAVKRPSSRTFLNMISTTSSPKER
jgi:hypothetical protein